VVQLAVEFLVPQEKYLEAGMHIGTKTKTGSMRQFIYKARDDGLHVLDLKKLDERLRASSKLMAGYPAEKVYLVGGRDNALKPLSKFAELTGAQAITGRFTPGRFTNPARPDFVEPQVVFVVDPAVDKQAVKEASEIHVPVLALCDTNNTLKNVDIAIPTNNKGRKAIAMALWILAREVLKARGQLAANEEFKVAQQEFEA
jgi:small subunit ribosomal protein S2